MRIGILTTESEPEEDARLIEAARARGHMAQLLSVLRCSLSVAGGDSHIYYDGRPIEQEIDVVVPRIDVPHTDFGLTLMRQFQALGVATTDMASSLGVGRNKLRCLQYLMRENIPMPATGFAYTREDFVRMLGVVGGFPIVIKVLEGTQGDGVYLAHSEAEALDIFDAHNTTGMQTIIQQFIGESAGTDFCSFVVGGRIVANMRRVAQGGDFRANVSLGAHSFATELLPEEERMVLDAVCAIGINIAGVDFVRSNRGSLILEINTSPGFTGAQGIEAVTGVDVAGAMIEFAAACQGRPRSNCWHNIPESRLELPELRSA